MMQPQAVSNFFRVSRRKEVAVYVQSPWADAGKPKVFSTWGSANISRSRSALLRRGQYRQGMKFGQEVFLLGI